MFYMSPSRHDRYASPCFPMAAGRYVCSHNHGPGECPRMRALSLEQQDSTLPTQPFQRARLPDASTIRLCHATPTCGTCHAIPPNGSVSPNVAGQHAPHIAVSTIIVCATCHTGAGDGTALHQNGTVDVIIDPTYNAKSGAASYNATNNTCTNVSCHGGQTTPGWLSGTVIDVNTQCTSCHASGTAQYNSYNSGQHSTARW